MALLGAEERQGGNLVPYAPSLSRWTDDHYAIFTLIELELGNRKELTPEEKEEEEFAQDIDDIMNSGDPNWLKKVQEKFGDDGNLDNLVIDEDFLKDIDKEERRRGN